ncbi:MAG TPA: signal peptidase II [bacterium]
MKTPILKALWPTIVILILDQISKAWVRSSMALWESHRVLGDHFFRLTHVRNTGVAFGVQAGSRIFLIAFSVIASIFLIYILLKAHREQQTQYPPLVRFALALILGGAVGNLIDRIFFGYVTDFLDFDFPDFIMERWPVFNVSDSAVTVGVTLWIICIVLFSKRKQATGDSKL